MRSPTVSVAAAGALAVVLATSGCTGLDDPAAAQDIARNDLVAELATQLGNATARTYSATYRLRGGDTASLSQAQDPPRTVLVHPGGRVITTDDSVTTCAPSTKGLVCTVTSPPGAATPGAAASPAAVPGVAASGAAASAAEPSSGGPARRRAAARALDASTLAAATDTGMVLPSTVLALLDTAALDTGAGTDQHDTTIAGHHATCIDLDRLDGAEVGDLSVCVTNEGALGSFTGTLAGTRIDVAMTRWSESVDSDAFTVPPNATTVDRRRR